MFLVPSVIRLKVFISSALTALPSMKLNSVHHLPICNRQNLHVDSGGVQMLVPEEPADVIKRATMQ